MPARFFRTAFVAALALFTLSCNRAPESDPMAGLGLQELKLEYRFKRVESSPAALIDFTLTNTGTDALRGAQISCDQLSESGAKLKSVSLTVAESIAPGKSVQRSGFNSGFEQPSGSTVRCDAMPL